MNKCKICSNCDHSTPSYRPTAKLKIWCFDMMCNVSDDCAVGCREYKDRDEAQLERELAGIVQASYNGG